MAFGIDTTELLAVDWARLLPLGLVGIVSWGVWGIRRVLSTLYRPRPVGFRTTVSVVVPAYREDPAILSACLDTWFAEEPDEVVVVLDGDDAACRAVLVDRADPRLHLLVIRHEGKRSAIAAGVRAARGAVVVLTDSDTRWTPGLLAAVQAPFDDPWVGAVGTRQNVHRPDTSVWRRIADWMIDNRYLDYVPATGRAGGVVCVSGRTAAYRRDLLLTVLPELEHEYFLGRRCVSGDDGRLTWLVLARGYRTVHQSSARAYSMFPATFRGFCRQRVRWSRNSYRCYLTALWQGWFFRVPAISQLTVVQILLTPLTAGASVYYLAAAGTGLRPGVTLALAGLWLLLGRALRSVAHLRRRPSDLLLLPVAAAAIVFVALPIKAYAFLTMNRQGWLTRGADRVGGEGQDAASLAVPGTSSPLRERRF